MREAVIERSSAGGHTRPKRSMSIAAHTTLTGQKARTTLATAAVAIVQMALFAQAPLPAQDTILTLDAAMARALEANPTLVAARLRR